MSQIEPPAEHRNWSLIPFTRVPIWVPIFDQQPFQVSIHLGQSKKHVFQLISRSPFQSELNICLKDHVRNYTIVPVGAILAQIPFGRHLVATFPFFVNRTTEHEDKGGFVFLAMVEIQ